MVRSFSEPFMEKEKVVLAISLDIANAFNFLSWDSIRGALRYHGLPAYLREVVEDYFRDRSLEFRDNAELTRVKELYCRVSQSSVLGLFLWNLAYDKVLWTALSVGCDMVCYVDDILILARRDNWEDARVNADIAVADVVQAISRLRLKMATKTEALFFHGRASGQPLPTQIIVETTSVPVGSQIKYLGLILDSTWGFEKHFELLASRVDRLTSQLDRLLLNLNGSAA